MKKCEANIKKVPEYLKGLYNKIDKINFKLNDTIEHMNDIDNTIDMMFDEATSYKDDVRERFNKEIEDIHSRITDEVECLNSQISDIQENVDFNADAGIENVSEVGDSIVNDLRAFEHKLKVTVAIAGGVLAAGAAVVGAYLYGRSKRK